MRPRVWQPPVECSRLELAVMQRVKRARLFVWLRQHRHELLDEGFQAELAQMYAPRLLGQPPVPPAQLALATILQGYVGCSDDEVIEACVMDRRWQLVLDCMDHAQPPFSKGTLVAFRTRLIAAELDRRLVERTVELSAQQAGRPAAGKLRAALDAGPLWGAGRVEDTINLVGHALRLVLGVLGGRQGWGLAAPERARVLAGRAGIDVLAGPSVKAALDLDWDDPRVAGALAAARQVRDQDVMVDPDGVAQIRQGVARDRRISVADPQMRHGRKTKSRRVDGDKRHVLRDLDSGLVRSVGVTPANLPEAEVAGQVQADLDAQGVQLDELHVDRGHLASALVHNRTEDLEVFCKAFPVRAPGGRFAKPSFTIDFDTHTLTCPNKVTMAFTPGGKVQFPAAACQACPLRERCTTSPRGRSVQVHPDERLLVELRTRQPTPAGGPGCANG